MTMIICKACNNRYYDKESDLRKELSKFKNLNLIENKLRLVLQHLWQPDKEIALGNERIDLLCYKQSELFILELKRYRGSYKAFAQVLSYMLQIKKKLPGLIKHYKKIRGVIVAHHITESLADLVSEYQKILPRIDLTEYHVDAEGQFIITRYS